MKVTFLCDDIEYDQLMLYSFDINEKCKLIYKKFKYADVDVKPKDIISYMKFIYKVTEGKEDYDSIKLRYKNNEYDLDFINTLP